ncbi:MAG: lipopolysaccharide kinase InaA family protein [Planctomycetota bacterium]|nr:lipopolysaccharide kinase InaA family protein [Planctomycetota bacterium]
MSETWWIAPDARQRLERHAPLDVAAWMQHGDDRVVLSTDRQSAAVRWQGDESLLVKWRATLPGRRRRTWMRASRERKEARALRRAATLGIATPQVLGVAERRERGFLLGSVVVRPYDEQAESAADAARRDPNLVLLLAGALRGWHDAGFRHGDCYPKNMLVGGAAGEPRPIGCPMATFVRAGPQLDRARLKDLGQFTAGCAALEPWGDPFTFLMAYGEEPGLPPYDELMEAVTPFYERVMERKAERERTRPEREPDGPPQPKPLGVGGPPKVRVRGLGRL